MVEHPNTLNSPGSSLEAPTEQESFLLSLQRELNMVSGFSRDGLYEIITPDRFPVLHSFSPDLLTTHRMDAIANRSTLLFRALRNSGGGEVEESILAQMTLVKEVFAEMDFVTKPVSTDRDKIFWMNDQEREGFRMAHWSGDYEAINESNFQFLKGMDSEVADEMRAEAVQNRINRLIFLVAGSKKVTGFMGAAEQKDPFLTEMEGKISGLEEVKRNFLKHIS